MSNSLKDKETSYPSFTTTHVQIHRPSKNEMLHISAHQPKFQPPPMQHFVLPLFQPHSELSTNEKYPPLIHTQPLVPGPVYIPHVNDGGSASPSPSTTRCSSSTLALCDDDTRNIFTSCHLGPDPMMTPPPVCEKREQLMTRELLMMSPHTSPYVAPFYAVNRSGTRDDRNQMHKDLGPQLPPPPLKVAPYHSLERTWNKHFISGLGAPDLPVMGFYARRLVHCDCIWDADELMHLSRAFVWRASECGERPIDALVAFASEVYRVFHIAPWMGTDDNFRRCLWAVAGETFVSAWYFEEQRTSRRAVTYIKDPSPGYKEYVVSALSVCSFIGDLFRYNFIARPDTVGCIRILMHNLTTVEHITAIYNIIKHAGIRLWREAVNLDAEVWEFRKVLSEKSQPLKDYRTVLLQPVRVNGNVGVRSGVNGIFDLVENCRIAVVNEQRTLATSSS